MYKFFSKFPSIERTAGANWVLKFSVFLVQTKFIMSSTYSLKYYNFEKKNIEFKKILFLL